MIPGGRASLFLASRTQRELNPETRQFERRKRLPFAEGRQPAVDAAIKSLCSLKHPLLSPITRYDFEPGAVNIWSPELPASLTAVLADDSKTLDANSVLICLYGVATGLQWLHANGRYHGGLNLGNVLLDDQRHPRLADVGLWSVSPDACRTVLEQGALKSEIVVWWAPETIEVYGKDTTRDLGPPADVYSFGILAFHLIARLLGASERYPVRLPKGHSVRTVASSMLKLKKDLKTEGIPSPIQELIQGCLAYAPDDRPTMARVVAFFDEHRPSALAAQASDEAVTEYMNSVRPKMSASARKLKALADAGNADAMCFLGVLLENGGDIQRDQEKAWKLFRDSARKKSPWGEFKYGQMLQFGTGVPQDLKEAAKQYELAADRNNSDALNNLGGLVEKGVVPGGFARAAELYQKSATLNNPCGQYNWARFLELGRGCARDQNAAERFYQLAATGGQPDAAGNLSRLKGEPPENSPPAQIARGLHCLQAGQFFQAAGHFRGASLGGSAIGTFNLACLAQKGFSPGDDHEALYRQAVAAGNAPAQNNLAVLLADSATAEAVALLKQAAEAGDPYAQLNYGLAIEAGRAQEDITVAADLYNRARLAQIPEAMANYADLLAAGNGVPANPEQARNYYDMAYQASQRRLLTADIGAKHLSGK
jgi:TPR repeat protein